MKDSIIFVCFFWHSLNIYYDLQFLLKYYMIKESFLRNYSLTKIYTEAEDQKKKIKVFYVRQVKKMLKERQKKEKLVEIQSKRLNLQSMKSSEKQNDKKGQQNQQKSLNKSSPKPKQQKNDNKYKKVNLKITEIMFSHNLPLPQMVIRQKQKLKISMNKSFFGKINNTSVQSPFKTFVLFDRKENQASNQGAINSRKQCYFKFNKTNPSFFHNIVQKTQKDQQTVQQKSHDQLICPKFGEDKNGDLFEANFKQAKIKHARANFMKKIKSRASNDFSKDQFGINSHFPKLFEQKNE